MKYLILFILFCLPNVSFGSVGCVELPPVDDFTCNVEATYALCSVTMQVALLDSSRLQDALDCITKYKTEIKPVYNAAKKALSKNKEATNVLKDLYSYWLTSMDSLIPDPSELKIVYERRLSDRKLGIQERANRLKVEAD
jgi:hypothetical protein